MLINKLAILDKAKPKTLPITACLNKYLKQLIITAHLRLAVILFSH